MIRLQCIIVVQEADVATLRHSDAKIEISCALVFIGRIVRHTVFDTGHQGAEAAEVLEISLVGALVHQYDLKRTIDRAPNAFERARDFAMTTSNAPHH
ncbi:hypothetical protein CF68_18010 [Cupriavidus sp. SK-4]|nr:hypothetical protein CF68_18010 [Cupriavidus sp. SK-4]